MISMENYSETYRAVVPETIMSVSSLCSAITKKLVVMNKFWKKKRGKVKLISKTNIKWDIAVHGPVSATTGQLGVPFKKSVFLMLTTMENSNPTDYFRSRGNRKAHNADYVRFFANWLCNYNIWKKMYSLLFFDNTRTTQKKKNNSRGKLGTHTARCRAVIVGTDGQQGALMTLINLKKLRENSHTNSLEN